MRGFRSRAVALVVALSIPCFFAGVSIVNAPGGSGSGYFDGSGVASGPITGNDTLDIQASDDAAQTLRIFGDATKYLSLSHDGTNGIVDTQSADLLLKRAGVTRLTLGSGTTTIGSGANATEVLASNLSGANDPIITFGNDFVRVDTSSGATHYLNNSTDSKGRALVLGWASGFTTGGTNDTGLSRISAGVVGVGNGTAGNVSGTLQAASVDSGAATDLLLKYNGSTVVSVANGSLTMGGTASLQGNGTSFALGFKQYIESFTVGQTLAANRYQRVITNESATVRVDHTLPTAQNGGNYTFIVQDADGVRITAATGDTIRVIDKVTASAGYIESTTIGSVVTLVAINATEWVATSIHGTWTDGTFTYDDTGNTTP